MEDIVWYIVVKGDGGALPPLYFAGITDEVKNEWSFSIHSARGYETKEEAEFERDIFGLVQTVVEDHMFL